MSMVVAAARSSGASAGAGIDDVARGNSKAQNSVTVRYLRE